MAYACPVCEEPQADGEHLANHLAFSAMLGRADHADWLDEHAPGWDEDGPEELAERVCPHAESVEVDVETEEGSSPDVDVGGAGPGGHPGDAHGPTGDAHGPAGPGAPTSDGERLDPEARRILEEARAMTEQRRDAQEDDEESVAGDDGADGSDGEDDAADGGAADEKG